MIHTRVTKVDSIKTQCRTLKARVTSASNRLRAIVKTNNESLINSALDALHQLYEQFCVADLEYCELVESGTSTEYSASVLETYSDAIALITTNQVSPLRNEAMLAITKVKQFCSEFSDVMLSFDYDTACKLLEKAGPYLCECQGILSKLASFADSNLLPELGSYATDLDIYIFQVELKVITYTALPTEQDISYVSFSKNISVSNNKGDGRITLASMGAESAVSGTPSGIAVIGSSVG